MSVNLRHTCSRGPFLDLLFITRVSNPLYHHFYTWKNLTEFFRQRLVLQSLNQYISVNYYLAFFKWRNTRGKQYKFPTWFELNFGPEWKIASTFLSHEAKARYKWQSSAPSVTKSLLSCKASNMGDRGSRKGKSRSSKYKSHPTLGSSIFLKHTLLFISTFFHKKVEVEINQNF